MPCLADGPKGRAAINAPLLAEIVARTRAPSLRRMRRPTASEGAVGGFASAGAKASSKASWPPKASR